MRASTPGIIHQKLSGSGVRDEMNKRTFFWAFTTGDGMCLATTSTKPDADPRNFVKISFSNGLGSK